MFGFGKKKTKQKAIVATQTGKLIPLTEVPDDVFAQKILGDGVAVIPNEETVYSPVDGTIVDISDTFHAVGITTDDGVDFLVHVGLDTVAMKGEGFTVLVKVGDAIKAGEPMLKANLEAIKAHGYQCHTPTVITDMSGITLTVAEETTLVGGKTVVGYYEKA